MMEFKSTKMTRQTAQALGGLYLLYAFFMMKFSTLLFSLALGLIVLGLLGSMEIAVAAAMLVGLMFHALGRRKEGFQTTDPLVVAKQLADIRARTPANVPLSTMPTSASQAQGVLSSSFAEGFSDVTPAQAAEAEGASSASAPASASSAPAPAEKKEMATAGFTGTTGTDGLFKLGELPTETKGGAHIDAGSTILNAISGLKPEQISAMTEDTRKLLDTQKSLLGMLQNMKPMLADSQQLFSTFSGMFGQNAGAK